MKANQRDHLIVAEFGDNIRSEENNGQGNAKPTENQGESTNRIRRCKTV